jgi:hypothetical protein
MFVRRITTERDRGEALGLPQGIRSRGFNELTFAAASREPNNGNITMALEADNQRFCKVVHTENGRTWTRRIHTMMVQTANGQLHHLQGRNLPDSISLYSGVPYSGAHLAEVLLSPKDAKGTPLLPTETGWLTKRDAFFVVLGFFFFRLISFLAEQVGLALT